MIQSMTGYSVSSQEIDNVIFTAELKSVNHRFLEFQFKLPEEIRHLEFKIRNLLRSKISRGKIECKFNIHNKNEKLNFLNLDKNFIKKITTLNKEILKVYSTSRPLSVFEILQLSQNVNKISPRHAKKYDSICLKMLSNVLNDLIVTKKKEGSQTCKDVKYKISKIRKLVSKFNPEVKKTIKKIDEKIKNKLSNLTNEIDNDRIYQELFLYMAKNDIDEEISRINSHLNSFTNLLNKNEPCGRKLDFLSQELNREANTIGAKSSSLEISSRIVETKTLIEQIREQVQNIE